MPPILRRATKMDNWRKAMKAIKVILLGIILILSSLFFMGICIINAHKGGPQGLTVFLFIAGIIVSIIGLFFVKDDD